MRLTQLFKRGSRSVVAATATLPSHKLHSHLHHHAKIWTEIKLKSLHQRGCCDRQNWAGSLRKRHLFISERQMCKVNVYRADSSGPTYQIGKPRPIREQDLSNASIDREAQEAYFGSSCITAISFAADSQQQAYHNKSECQQIERTASDLILVGALDRTVKIHTKHVSPLWSQRKWHPVK